MRLPAITPKDWDKVLEIYQAMGELLQEYQQTRQQYISCRQRELGPQSYEVLAQAHQETSAAWGLYQEAVENLQSIHRDWKSLFSKMTQERQL